MLYLEKYLENQKEFEQAVAKLDKTQGQCLAEYVTARTE